jgi:molybdenum cofactor biosynthesis protein B
MKPHEEHRKKSSTEIKIGIITISSSKYEDSQTGKEIEDISGDIIRKKVQKLDYSIVSNSLISDNMEQIRQTILSNINEKNIDALIITGGTGLSSRDVTIESVRPLFDKEMDGFGEIFRNLSYLEIGSPAHLSRATAGVIDSRVVYCLPGSPNAVETALKIILDELPHTIKMAKS